MKIKSIIFLLATVQLFSCKHSEYKQKILGDWKLVALIEKTKGKIIEHPLDKGYLNADMGGFNFINVDTVDNKVGFVSVEKRHYPPFNPKTTYKLIGDSVSIFNYADSSWQGFKIENIDDDTMYVKSPIAYFSPFCLLKYVRQHYTVDTSITFDQIILTDHSGWGLRDDISINKNGEVIYRGPLISSHAYYISKISKLKFKKIQDGFANANFKKLKSGYSNGAIDASIISLTFIKDGKVIKSIEDNDRSSPSELIWAYIPLQRLHDELKMDSVTTPSIDHDISMLNLKTKNREAHLTPSQTFYLINLIKKSKKVSTPFVKKYEVEFYRSAEISKITSDGQFFTITLKNGNQQTYDIGFNFLAANADIIKFADKKKD